MIIVYALADVSIEQFDRVMEELKEITDWYELGIHLKVPYHALRGIEVQFSGAHGVQRCKYEVIRKWWDLSSNADWGDIIGALRKMEKKRLATQLEKKYKTSTPQPPAQNIVQPAEHGLDDLSQLPSRGQAIYSCMLNFIKVNCHIFLL